jgi:hypothetical protein
MGYIQCYIWWNTWTDQVGCSWLGICSMFSVKHGGNWRISRFELFLSDKLYSKNAIANLK